MAEHSNATQSRRAETTADALLSGLGEAGVGVVFANFGSDHPGIIEALASARECGESTPAVVLAPHEASANATKQNLVRQHPGGVTDTAHRYWVDLAQTADLAGVAAAAGGALASTVTKVAELEPALGEALSAVRTGRSAVLRAVLDRIAEEPADSVPEAGTA